MADRELKLFSVQIETWGSPLSIRALDANNAEGLTRMHFNIATEVGITVTPKEEETNGISLRSLQEENRVVCRVLAENA